ncbi:MAG: glycosyltransferase family 4 protein [Muribaculaceae bacterium]|nr:glycosyltransferase family 4 protein [Muribaculaceae bacterium]
MAQDKRLLIVVNEDAFFLSHRKEIGIAANRDGWKVAVVGKNTGKSDEIKKLGIEFIEMPVNPTGKKLHQEIKTLKFLLRLYGRERDAIVHHVGLKNMVWGGVAARVKGVAGVVNAVSGLGILFSDYNPSKLRKLLIPVLKWGMKRGNVTVIFQNHEDESLFQALGITSKVTTHYIKGSGVDLDQYEGKARSKGDRLRVIFSGRMVKDKGVLDFIKAAELLREKYEGKVEFVMCGALSSNPYAVKKEELERLCDGDYIRWIGFREDMPQQFEDADIMCFPSYYREGVPKAVIDASAAGLPIVTCDSIGCRDTVANGVNGFLVKPQSPEEVAAKLDILLGDADLRARMGAASRKMAEKDYDVKQVVRKHLDIYSDTINRVRK